MKGMSIAGLICGIVALVLAWFGWVSIIALALAITGLVLSVKGGKALKAAGQSSGVATAGLVISIIALVLSAILFLTCGLCDICACIAGETVEAGLNAAAGAI